MIEPDEKRQIVAALIQQLAAMVETALRSAGAAQGGIQVGSERTRNRGERGQFLEATYLISAQVRQADEYRNLITRLKELDLAPAPRVREGSLVAVAGDEGTPASWYFLAAGGMGLVVQQGEHSVHVLSPESPLGQALLGRRAGTDARVQLPGGEKKLHILWVA